ncbi:hypothetical protein PP935_gp002 [Rhizobium phage RHph_N34]|uniref:Uncharacterized protein n=1 Tax=Rhizobium phage RHph_N34 TaxID=2509586 RepID=A0A7S5RA74_9CAUD|nr:hypothetical protein PP935_gp002 [Rhizobium phage RHph_N34]QIG73777.1 hypothetical protein EVC06_002 [Rhizobium phage RHph_N34]
MFPKGMKSKKDVEEIVVLTKNLEEAQRLFKEKPSGYHPNDLAVAVQKAKRIRDAEVNTIRSSFFVIGGKDKHVQG